MIGLITYCVIIYLLGGIGASLGYHRILTHKSAVLPKGLEYFIILIGLPAGTPVQWVGNHRAHHKYTDVAGDPHSPVLDGFWYAHCGWYIRSTNPFLCFLYALSGPVRMYVDSFLRPRTNLQYNQFAKDIEADAFYRFISKPIVYNVVLLIYLSVLVLVSWIGWGWTGIIAMWVSLIVVYNLGDGVNSFGHLYGEKKSVSRASNNRVLGWLSFGDGWHANHHNNPILAKHGQDKFQFDLSFLILEFLKKIKVVSKIHLK